MKDPNKLNPNSEERQRIDRAMIGAILRESLQGAGSEDEDRVQRFLGQIELDTERAEQTFTSGNRNETFQPSVSRRKWYWRAASIAVAAVLLLSMILFVRPGDSSRQAYATVQQVIDNWSKQKNRKYTIRMTRNRALGGTADYEATLYLNDQDEFVMRRPKWNRFQFVWIGGSADERWIVPERGPIIVGDENLVGRWLEHRDVDTPYLNVRSMMSQMARRYDLSSLGTESLQVKNEGTTVACEHVRGMLRNDSNRRLPKQIDLWANPENGNAMKITMAWERADGEAGPITWTFELVGHPELQEDWFSYQGHDRLNRRPIQIRRKEDLRQFDRDQSN